MAALTAFGQRETGVIRWTVPGHARVLLRTPVNGTREIDAVLPRKVVVPGDEDSPAAVGDRVQVEWAREGPMVVSVERRTSTLVRRASGKRPARQVLCANADTLVCVMAAAEPEPRWGMLDRYLVIARLCGLEPLIVLSKSDLTGPGVTDALERYGALGYTTTRVCARSGAGLEALRSRLSGPGRSSVIVGKSGVGKSTLLNALVPGASQVVGEVGATTSKGRHTTTLAVLFELPNVVGGDGAVRFLIDTPGVREIAPWGLDPSDVSSGFVEIAAAAAEGCRFAGSCTHAHEGGCAVRDAVERGRIHPERYESYLRLREAAALDAAQRR